MRSAVNFKFFVIYTEQWHFMLIVHSFKIENKIEILTATQQFFPIFFFFLINNKSIAFIDCSREKKKCRAVSNKADPITWIFSWEISYFNIFMHAISWKPKCLSISRKKKKKNVLHKQLKCTACSPRWKKGMSRKLIILPPQIFWEHRRRLRLLVFFLSNLSVPTVSHFPFKALFKRVGISIIGIWDLWTAINEIFFSKKKNIDKSINNTSSGHSHLDRCECWII